MADLTEALAKLSLKDGDLVFVDASAIGVEALEHACANGDSKLPCVTFIFASCRYGQSVEDAVFAMSRDELEMLLKEKSE